MFCPRCGQQQATDSMRFCSRCGFSMEGVMHLLAHGGMLPQYPAPTGEKKISARRKGVKQGAALMLIGAILVPILFIMSSFAPGRIETLFEFFGSLAAVLCFVGGPLRMLFAALFEEAAKPQQYVAGPSYVPPAIPPVMPPQRARISALPPPAVGTEPWRVRPQTAEIVQPPSSVTDHTTKLLERSDSEKE
jgi:hypothetical protein